jgi:hypothetical protein
VNSMLNSASTTCSPGRLSLTRTSEILRSILTKNPDVQAFSVERILASIGHERFEASLMMFSIPAIVPVPAPLGIVTLPTGAIACQLAAGKKQIALPSFMLNKSVSRRSLAVAIHAILPILEAAEKLVRPRWHWVTHPIARRVIGMLVFVLAIAIAQPLFGFNAFHATSVFAMSLGLAERDGLVVLIGVVAGVLSLSMLAVSGTSLRVLRAKAGRLLRKIGRRLGLATFAKFLERLGYKRLGRVLAMEWSEFLLMWDPEKPIVERPRPVKVQSAAPSTSHGRSESVRVRRSPASAARLKTRVLESQRSRPGFQRAARA